MLYLLDLYLSLCYWELSWKFTYGFCCILFLWTTVCFWILVIFFYIFIDGKIFSYYFKNWYINIMLVFFCLHRLWFLQGIFSHLFSLLCFFLKNIFSCLMILRIIWWNRFLSNLRIWQKLTKFCGADGAGLLWRLLYSDHVGPSNWKIFDVNITSLFVGVASERVSKIMPKGHNSSS